MPTVWEGTAKPLNHTPVVPPKKVRLDPYVFVDVFSPVSWVNSPMFLLRQVSGDGGEGLARAQKVEFAGSLGIAGIIFWISIIIISWFHEPFNIP